MAGFGEALINGLEEVELAIVSSMILQATVDWGAKTCASPTDLLVRSPLMCSLIPSVCARLYLWPGLRSL